MHFILSVPVTMPTHNRSITIYSTNDQINDTFSILQQIDLRIFAMKFRLELRIWINRFKIIFHHKID